MPIPIQCPECAARLTAPDAAGGKKIKCPKCGAALAVPAPASAFEVVDEPEPEPEADERKPRRAKRIADADASEDEEARPRRAKRRPAPDEDDRPGKKRGKAPARGNKPLLLALAGVGLLLAVGGIGAAVWFSRTKAPEAADGGEGKPGGTGPGAVGDGNPSQVPAIAPRARFKTEFAKKGITNPLEVRQLFLTPDGGRVAVANNDETQVWSVAGDPKKLHTSQGRLGGLSDDGALIFFPYAAKDRVLEVETGKPAQGPFVGDSADYLAGIITGRLHTPTGVFRWHRSTDWRKAAPFRIAEENPSGKIIGTYVACDDDRVELAPPIKQGKELVFSVPAQNKVRVFDFSTKSVVREFALANLKEYRGPSKSANWSAFAVSRDGKWLAAKRVYLGREPDVIELFDGAGAVVATLPAMSVSDFHGAFLHGRDVYVAPAYSRKGSAFRAGDVAAFDLGRKALVAAFRGHEKPITRLVLSADGKVMATGDTGGEVCVWDLAQLK